MSHDFILSFKWYWVVGLTNYWITCLDGCLYVEMCGGLRSTSAALRLSTLSYNALLVCVGTPAMGMQTGVTGQCCGVGFSLHFTWVLGNGIQVARPAWQEPPLTETAPLPTLFSRQGSPGGFEAHRLGWAANQPAPICLSAFSELGTSAQHWDQCFPSAAAPAQAFLMEWRHYRKSYRPVSGDGSKPDFLKFPFSHNRHCVFQITCYYTNFTK